MRKEWKILLSMVLCLIGILCLSIGFNSSLTRQIEISDGIRVLLLLISLMCFTSILYLKNEGVDRKYIFMTPLIIVVVSVIAYILFRALFI